MKTKIRVFTGASLFFALLLCIGIFGSLFGVTAKAEPDDPGADPVAAPHTHCFCGGGIELGDHSEHSDVTYQSWDGGDFDYDGGDTGVAYLYLTEDVVNNAHPCNRTDGDGILSVKSGQTLYLCLNGHSLKNGNTSSNVIDIYGTLYLCDCTGGGTIGGRTSGANSGAIWLSGGALSMYGGSLTGSCGVKNGGGIYAADKSKVTMYGGAITGNTVTRQAGGVYLLSGSSFVMYGGTISGNSAPDYGGGVIVDVAKKDDGTSFTMYGGSIENNVSGRTGGGVFVSGGAFTMHGGTIAGNKAANGGGISVTWDVVRGSLEMFDGTISGNTAFGNGGGVHVWDRATFTMHKGSITGNEATYGGGICLYSANKDTSGINNVLNLYGGEIRDNTASGYGGGIACFQYSVLNFDGSDPIRIDGNRNSNLYFADVCSLTITKLAENSAIGVSSITRAEKGKPVTFYSANAEAFGKYFFSDSADYVITYGADGIALTADFFTSTIKYETGCDTVIPPQVGTGFTEAIELGVTDIRPGIPCRRFLGWATDADADTAQYTAGDTISVTGELTLYAIFEDVPHTLTPVAEVEATCEHDGVRGYYVCSECGKRFIDGTDGTKIEVTSDEQLVIAGGHKYGEWQETVEATTDREGTVAHRDCTSCGKHFDADGEELTDLTIAKLPLPEEPEVPEVKGDDKSLPNGAVVGISIGATTGALLGLEALAYVVYRLILKKRKHL